MDKIQLDLTIDEANIILEALGQQPYLKVASLIQKIQQEGEAQIQSEIVQETTATPTKVTTEKLAKKAETSSTNGN